MPDSRLFFSSTFCPPLLVTDSARSSAQQEREHSMLAASCLLLRFMLPANVHFYGANGPVSCCMSEVANVKSARCISFLACTRANSCIHCAARLRLCATSPVPAVAFLSLLHMSAFTIFCRRLVQTLVALIACDNPPPSAAATKEALSAIQENLCELDALCRAASVPFVSADSLQELQAQRDLLAAQATANNVRAFRPSRALL